MFVAVGRGFVFVFVGVGVVVPVDTCCYCSFSLLVVCCRFRCWCCGVAAVGVLRFILLSL